MKLSVILCVLICGFSGGGFTGDGSGEQVNIIEDAVLSESDDLKKEMIKEFRNLGAKIIGTKDFLASVAGQ